MFLGGLIRLGCVGVVFVWLLFGLVSGRFGLFGLASCFFFVSVLFVFGLRSPCDQPHSGDA